jgi:hypothetical protein
MNLLELFEKIEDNSLTPNQYYLLWSIKNKRKPKGINGDLELRGLIADGFIKDGKLTEIANMLITDQITTTNVVVDDIDKYLSIFPKGKLPSGKPARVNKRNIEEAFKWFFKNYKYEWSTVIAATVYYVDSFEKDNFKFMRNSQYFIRKQNSDKSWDSELANCCDIVLSGDDQDDSPHFSERVV